MTKTARPFGYFVHHQGRGHAERCAALVHALPAARPVAIFCARDDIFPPLPAHATVHRIPSLFEPRGTEPGGAAALSTPETLHCAPVGWSGIREAMGQITRFFVAENPALMICDVSAEVAQLARICSVPHVKVLQHGDRGDPGHRAAYDGAAGLLAPFHAALAQPDWSDAMRVKTHFAPGLGTDARLPSRAAARARLGIARDARVALVISGGGGSGIAEAPLGVAARSHPDMQWITIGTVQRDWHATLPPNLTHKGWVEDAPEHIAAADLIVSSTGNTTCAQVLRAGVPWIVVPEWRYFDEQLEKARALAREGAALHLPHLPASAHRWVEAVEQARDRHDPAAQAALAGSTPPEATARWLEDLASRLWDAPRPPKLSRKPPMPQTSVLTIAKGRDANLRNVIRGLAAQSQQPLELVIGVMQDGPYTDLPAVDFPIRQITIPLVHGELPLARARNAVAAAAQGEVLAFVDVDCIPHPEFVADLARACTPGRGLVMGEVAYLPAGATGGGLDFALFDRIGVRHSDRQAPPESGLQLCEDYRCFWSLNFAMHRDDWAQSGGFCEAYYGYGGEDTDFGRGLAESGIDIWWTKGARVYHQYHEHCMPPVHHLDSVMRNADVFASRWGFRTMEHWLFGFRLMGLLELKPDGSLHKLREPDAADYELCRQTVDMPYANTRRVLDKLQEVTVSDAARTEEVARQQADMRRIAAE